MRTHYCGQLNVTNLGQTVALCGWAHRRRDHGGVIFIDLRDREGLAQIVCDPDRREAFAAAERVRNEFVLRVTGELRREPMPRNLRLRYRVAMAVRGYLDAHGFIDIETPMLTRSTPEGARDYLVPSRVNEGMFFALPQSPQLFKQLLMVAGF